jgi:APA family basic amino acid/polyamine antiporter
MSTTDTSGRSSGLVRILGVGFGLAVIVGSTIGIGILRTPGLVAGQLPSTPGILLMWLAGGLYTLVGAACIAELGTMLPRAGGYYVYARRAFGDGVGFAVGWIDWVTYCAVLGYISIAAGEFAPLLLPAFAGFEKAFAIFVLAALAALQLAGLRASSRFQELTTALKCAAFLALIVGAMILAPDMPAVHVPAVSGPTLGGVILALQAVVITYGGWQSALYFAEEDRDPQRNLPRSMIGGVGAVIVVYLLVNVALLMVLPLDRLAASTLPAADAAGVLLGGRGSAVITFLSIVSLPPTLNAVLMIGTRILFAMGRDGLVWRRVAVVSARGTPTMAMMATTVVALGLIATGTFQRLIAIASFFLIANAVVCCASLFALRRREPETRRPFRAPGYPWSVALVLAGSAAFLVGAVMGDTVNATGALVLAASGLVARRMFGAVRKPDQNANRTPAVG